MGRKNYEHLLPPTSEDVNDENLNLFFSSMFERQEIWYKRFILKQPRPWTKDKIFEGNFTNVYRELDRHSQWQIQNIFLDKRNDKLNLVWKIMLFRIFNKPELFEFIEKMTFEADDVGYDFGFMGLMPNYNKYNKELFGELIEMYRESGENPFTNAYLINSQACPGATRDWCYINKVVPTIHKAIPKLLVLFKQSKNPEQIIEKLLELPSVANFIAHEFYQDFTYISIYTDLDIFKFDQNDFTNVGPGAKEGIRMIFPNLETNKQQIKAIHYLRDIAEQKLSDIGDFKFVSWCKNTNQYKVTDKCNITLHQIEMWLCEFQKYWKMKHKVGKQRSVFEPKTI